MAVTKDQFLGTKRKMVSIELPDLGITVNILKGTLATIRAVQNIENGQFAKQLALILADDEGNRLFTEAQDIETLESMVTMSDATLLMDKWRELNGITKEQIEEATKNYKASTTEDSAIA